MACKKAQLHSYPFMCVLVLVGVKPTAHSMQCSSYTLCIANDHTVISIILIAVAIVQAMPGSPTCIQQ